MKGYLVEEEKVTGRACYAYDVRLPGLLYARVLRSPLPHTHIRRIDTVRVQALSGVRAVLSCANALRCQAALRRLPQDVTLGALTRPVDLETNPMIQQRYAALAEAAAVAATPQLRNMATLGGNLLQRPRCWYFRHPHVHCWLKGGETCPAHEGENQLHVLFGGCPCYAVHPSDIAPALLALDATVLLRGSDGERTLPLAEFFAAPVAERRLETVAQSDEILLAVHIPSLPDGTCSTYLKAMDRKVWAFALVGVAVMLASV